ncbi:MAG: glycosyltransferase family 1 protein [Candidatus Aquicultor sp.]|nr:glycosyltransferase family 1 protein [Candidatus Aquicultor sp.]
MAPSSVRPIRIMHVVGGMNRGGAETWLMHVLRNIDRDEFKMDFVVHTDQPCAFDDEIRDLGSKVIPCLNHSSPVAYARNLNNIMRCYGPYDVVHSHVHSFSGYILGLARRAGVPMRIAHSHLDTSDFDDAASYARRLYISATKRMVRRNATLGLAASDKAAKALFGEDWAADVRWRILYCGIDLAAFADPVDATAMRAELGIPADAFVIGHVGRFMEQKNHTFLIDIAAEVAQREPNMRLLLVGDGPLRVSTEQKVVEAGLSDKVIFAGTRPDVSRLMLGAMDVFVMPSLYEGLPLVGMEVQSAGLPMVISDAITEELDVVKPLVRRVSLSKQALAWAEEVLAMRNIVGAISQAQALSHMEQSGFNIVLGMKDLEAIYRG